MDAFMTTVDDRSSVGYREGRARRASAALRIAASVVRLVVTSASRRRWISAGRPHVERSDEGRLERRSVASTRSPAHQP